MLENENMIDLLGSLKEMSSEQLSRLIQEETVKESPNDDLVLGALDILEDREKDNPMKLGPKGKAAWIKYQAKARARQRETVLLWKPLMQVASVLLAITLLFALLPTQANAETWWERLARWTDDFFSFFNPSEPEVQEDDYLFKTNNEGLQEIYDAVLKMGITEPVVPMWLPNDFKMSSLICKETPAYNYVCGTFSDGDLVCTIRINLFHQEKPNHYFKSEPDAIVYEQQGTEFIILQNEDKHSVVWTIDNTECSIFIDCQEDVLYEILESIYRWRIINEESK